DSLLEAVRVLLPQQVVQEDAHRVETERLGPPELAVDARRIEGVGLPHFELVDRRRGNVVASDDPRLLCVPVAACLLGPALRLRPCLPVRGEGPQQYARGNGENPTPTLVPGARKMNIFVVSRFRGRS